jgi:hypothetical protein
MLRSTACCVLCAAVCCVLCAAVYYVLCEQVVIDSRAPVLEGILSWVESAVAPPSAAIAIAAADDTHIHRTTTVGFREEKKEEEQEEASSAAAAAAAAAAGIHVTESGLGADDRPAILFDTNDEAYAHTRAHTHTRAWRSKGEENNTFEYYARCVLCCVVLLCVVFRFFASVASVLKPLGYDVLNDGAQNRTFFHVNGSVF